MHGHPIACALYATASDICTSYPVTLHRDFPAVGCPESAILTLIATSPSSCTPAAVTLKTGIRKDAQERKPAIARHTATRSTAEAH